MVRVVHVQKCFRDAQEVSADSERRREFSDLAMNDAPAVRLASFDLGIFT